MQMVALPSVDNQIVQPLWAAPFGQCSDPCFSAPEPFRKGFPHDDFPHSPVARQDGLTFIELMDINAITANPATVAIRQYFFSIKIARALFVAGHFRIAGALAAAHAAANGGHIAI
jgi:hypothetical protein